MGLATKDSLISEGKKNFFEKKDVRAITAHPLPPGRRSAAQRLLWEAAAGSFYFPGEFKECILNDGRRGAPYRQAGRTAGRAPRGALGVVVRGGGSGLALRRRRTTTPEPSGRPAAGRGLPSGAAPAGGDRAVRWLWCLSSAPPRPDRR